MNRAEQVFACTLCGACCRRAGQLPELAAFDRGDGVCRHLVNDRCVIYEERPELCRIGVMYEKHYKQQMAWREFELLNLRACKAMQEEDDVPPALRVTVDETN